MSDDHPTPPPETEAELMDAVASVLYEAGYNGLTLRKVAAASTKSKSLLQHYYGTKDRLIRSFLEYLIDEYVAAVAALDGSSDQSRLESYLRWALSSAEETEFWQMHIAMLELQVQARHDEMIREQFATNYETVHGTVTTLIRDADVQPGGIADPATAATLITSFVWASRARHILNGDETALAEARHVLEALLPSFELDS